MLHADWIADWTKNRAVANWIVWSAAAILLSACAATDKLVSLRGHLSAETAQIRTPERAASGVKASDSNHAVDEIPAPVRHSYALPAARESAPSETLETYSVVAHEVPVRDLLFALARDAKLNVDIHSGISGAVTMNAVQQTLPQILERIARQTNIRIELDGSNLAVMPDMPFLRHYKIDYVNMSRNTSGEVATSTQIASSNARNGGDYENAVGTSFTSGGGNTSSTKVENFSRNHFWESLERSIRDILRDREDGSVIVHAETGLIAVRANSRQHERIHEFINRVTNAAHRQVMIEATIVEVALSDGYQQGIEWNRVWEDGQRLFNLTPTGFAAGASASTMPFTLGYIHATQSGNLVSATLNLLKSFGSTRVLSSPRLSVLNNQTALLKVVENVVYFNIKADITTGSANSNPVVAYTSTPQTVSVGLVMAVTPQISDTDTVILNVRPTISNIAGMVKDPNPDIPPHVSNEIPQIRTREIESVLRLASGEIAVLGGLMEDRVDKDSGRVPLAGDIPLIGEIFTSRHEAAKKSELVIFLRPIVVQDSARVDSSTALPNTLPDTAFWKDSRADREFLRQ